MKLDSIVLTFHDGDGVLISGNYVDSLYLDGVTTTIVVNNDSEISNEISSVESVGLKLIIPDTSNLKTDFEEDIKSKLLKNNISIITVYQEKSDVRFETEYEVVENYNNSISNRYQATKIKDDYIYIAIDKDIDKDYLHFFIN